MAPIWFASFKPFCACSGKDPPVSSPTVTRGAASPDVECLGGGGAAHRLGSQDVDAQGGSPRHEELPEARAESRTPQGCEPHTQKRLACRRDGGTKGWPGFPSPRDPRHYSAGADGYRAYRMTLGPRALCRAGPV